MRDTNQHFKPSFSLCIRFLTIMAMLMLLPIVAGAANGCKLEDTWRYTVNLEGTNKLRLKMPLYDKDGYDCWIVEGTVKIKIQGGSDETLFYYESQTDIDYDDYLPNIWYQKGVDGTMTLYRNRGYCALNVINSKKKDLCPCVDNQDYATFELLWDIPNKYRGKKVTVSWSIHHNGNVSESNTWISIDASTFDIPAAPDVQYPVVMDPVISYDGSRPNQMMVPYMISAGNLQSMTAHYTEVLGTTKRSKSVTLNNVSSDFVWLPADVCVKDFYIEATYLDSEKKSQTTQSSSIDLPILHHPKRLSATIQPDGKVVVTWGVNYTNWNDLIDSDTWEIQRNVTGDPTNGQWVTLGQVDFDEKTTEYFFEDESLLTAYQNQDVYYRVRRVVTAIWDWSPRSGYVTTMLPGTLALPTINNATVSRNGTWNDTSHGVTVNFGIGAREEYDNKGYLILRDSTDWRKFQQKVKEAYGREDINAIMVSDITTSRAIGLFDDSPYRGHFDGNGYTLTVDIDGGTAEGTAPFAYVRDARFSNLRVKGKVSGGPYSSGLVGKCYDYNRSNVDIEYCHVSTEIIGTSSNTSLFIGGLVGHANSSRLYVISSLFDGTMTAITNNSSYAGSFIGYADSDSKDNTIVKNCLELGTYSGFEHTGANWYDRMIGPWYWGGLNNYNSNGWFECEKIGDKDASELAAALGGDWDVAGSTVVPSRKVSTYDATMNLIRDSRAKAVLKIEKTVDGQLRYVEHHEVTSDELKEGKINLDLNTSCVDHRFFLFMDKGDSSLPLSYKDSVAVTKTETDDKAIYTFDNNVELASAKADTLQSAVSLSWEPRSGLADFYRILRYDKQNPDSVVVLEDAYTQTAYIDRTVQPQHNYVYTIEGVTQCEGDNVSCVSVEGCCTPTGMVRGYVRLANGIGLPGYTVTAEPVGSIDGAEILTCVTDSSGYFEIGGLIYSKYGEYTLTVTDPSREASFTAQSVVFDEDINLHTNIVFTQNNYYIFSGYVLYDGSSIPVSGVRFLRDGVEVVNSQGKPVTTDNQGAFSVSIPQGSHRIQVVKDGHVFKNEGFYITPDAKPDSTWHNWQKNVSEIYLWDETKVNLQGRVVGGNDQGLLPLGQSLSKNNLGDDVTLVFQLEGDNTSWIVRDQLNASVTERHEQFCHGKADTTRMDAYRHRIVVHPDPATGEFSVPFFPVKFKVTEIYAKGYPTLFQKGMVSETLDLNNYANGDTATYSRIYHSNPTLDIWQFNGTQERYYGLKQYTSMDNAGIRDTIRLWSKDNGYSLGHPVFMGGAAVPMVVSAREEYHYNNEALGELDVVQLDGGTVYVSNGLVSNETTDEVALDSVGQGTYVFTPQNTTFTQEGDMALRKMQFTLLYDGNYYDIQPIEAYVMAASAKPQGKRVVAGKNTHLIDILRDPPGSGSSAHIAAGSRFSYSYKADYTVSMGVEFTVGVGSGSNFYTGVWAGQGAGSAAGTISSTDNYGSLSYTLGTTYYQDWEYNYEFTTHESISTSSHAKDVSADADVYIGMTDNVIVEDAIAVRVVNSQALQRLRPGMGGKTNVQGHEFDVKGTAKVLARGYDAEKQDSVYLIRDEVMQMSMKLHSTFVHSQRYILSELLPNLVRQRNAMLLDSLTTPEYAQTLAESKQTAVYVSKVAPDNKYFSVDGYYTIYYPQTLPPFFSPLYSLLYPDEVLNTNNEINTWVGFIAANEKEKIESSELVKVYDFDGSTGVSYSESFSTTEGLHRYWKLPASFNISGEGGIGGQPSEGNYKNKKDNNGQTTDVSYVAGGIKFGLKIKPLFGFNFNYINGMSEGYSKEIGFNLGCSRNSNLSVAVYRAPEINADSIAKLVENGDMGVFYSKVEENLKNIYNGRPGSSNTTSYIESLRTMKRYRNFVYHTLGGATSSPWENERRTLFYNPGTILDQKTMEIDQLRIWAKESSVSNVPYGEPARFTIYMANESELPDRATWALNYYLEDDMNKKGAKVFVDGQPLTSSGIDLFLDPKSIVEKQVEVYAGAEYDYENIGISLLNPNDIKSTKTVTLTAHFVPTAGKINISNPGDKWVVNTESAYDEERQAYYLPVHIDGFDINYRNFDHIELQYKLSTQGDKDWVNICSYYPDNEEGRQRMAKASGERKLIENDGYIDAAFYGETDPVEQYYDLRAVTYCRQGSGYLTSSSNILTGIKDTRRPQLFGTPLPVNGILGIGDDIIMRFSEPIAGNYLSAVNNFEVTGQTKSSNISLSTALRFNGSGYAVSQAPRSLEGKSFTVDVMLNPEDNGKAMTFFSHGEGEMRMEIGLSSDRCLQVAIQVSDTLPPTVFKAWDPSTFDGLRQVFLVFNSNLEKGFSTVSLYDGTQKLGDNFFPFIYEGYGNIYLGQNTYDLLEGSEDYDGEMLEFRLWNRALTTAEMDSYRQKRLTGHELGLLDNYPLNEGKGNYSYNRTTGGSDLNLHGSSWKMPAGIGMKLDGKQGFRMDPSSFNRFDHEDYTLMFWYRTNQYNGTLLANGKAEDEDGAKTHFRIGLDNGALSLNLSGLKINTTTKASDGQWHHVALTVNRSRNVGCLYFDYNISATFAVDTLGGIRGNSLVAGATPLDAKTVEKAIQGNIDEIAMFEMAMTENGIKSCAPSTPTGEEMGLMAYLSFSENERQSDNSIRLMPTGVSMKRYKDTTTGELTARRDTIVAQADVELLCDRTLFAPMHDNQQLENIKFSYVADGKDLLINLDVPEESIEKSNVFVTVKEVADLQGNLMASPVMMDLYVYRNPLRWEDKHVRLLTEYGEQTEIEAKIYNLSGKTRRFFIDGLPVWMAASQTSGSIAALDEETLTFYISPYTNIGNYEEVISLVGDDGMTEQLPISLKVRGDKPDWVLDDELLDRNISMSVIGQVEIEDKVAHDGDDMLAAFNSEHRLLGVTCLDADATSGANDGLAYLTVYNSDYKASELSFEFFDASRGTIYKVQPDRTVVFHNDTVIGTSTAPVKFKSGDSEVQGIPLKKGWNWISFVVEPVNQPTVKELLNNATKWEVGDGFEIITSQGKPYLYSFKSRLSEDPNQVIYFWDHGNDKLLIDPTQMYRFYSNSDKVGYVAGTVSNQPISVKKGWNRIGFNSKLNLPLGTAMAEYTDKGKDGDILKSQSEFAILTIDATGNKMWKGTLEYMRVGEGYMLKRNADSEVSFSYPSYSGASRYSGVGIWKKKTSSPSSMVNRSGVSMTVVAKVVGVDVMPGDRLTAYRGAEVCGIAEADDEGVFYLNVGDTDNHATGMDFTLERGDEVISVTTRSQMHFAPDAALGTPDEPTAINFLPADQMEGDGWYTVSGIRLNKRPSAKGVYIHNGAKVVIR